MPLRATQTDNPSENARLAEKRFRRLTNSYPEIREKLVDQRLARVANDNGGAEPEPRIELTQKEIIQARLDLAIALYETGQVNPLETARLSGLWRRGEPLDEEGIRLATARGIKISDNDISGKKIKPVVDEVINMLRVRI